MRNTIISKLEDTKILIVKSDARDKSHALIASILHTFVQFITINYSGLTQVERETQSKKPTDIRIECKHIEVDDRRQRKLH
jgi:hypothetical protein